MNHLRVASTMSNLYDPFDNDQQSSDQERYGHSSTQRERDPQRTPHLNSGSSYRSSPPGRSPNIHLLLPRPVSTFVAAQNWPAKEEQPKISADLQSSRTRQESLLPHRSYAITPPSQGHIKAVAGSSDRSLNWVPTYKNANEDNVSKYYMSTASSMVSGSGERRTSAASPIFSGGGESRTSAASSTFSGGGERRTSASSPIFSGGGERRTSASSPIFSGSGESRTSVASPIFSGGGESRTSAASSIFSGRGERRTSAASSIFSGCGERRTSAASSIFSGGGESRFTTIGERKPHEQSIPGLGDYELPVRETASARPEFSQREYTLESASNILLHFGLGKDDLEKLMSYSEDQITPQNLPFILRQIRQQKTKNSVNVVQAAPYPEPKPSTSRSETDFRGHMREVPHQDDKPPCILKTSKVIDYGHISQFPAEPGEKVIMASGAHSVGSSTLLMDSSGRKAKDVSKSSPISSHDQKSSVSGLDSAFSLKLSSISLPTSNPPKQIPQISSVPFTIPKTYTGPRIQSGISKSLSLVGPEPSQLKSSTLHSSDTPHPSVTSGRLGLVLYDNLKDPHQPLKQESKVPEPKQQQQLPVKQEVKKQQPAAQQSSASQVNVTRSIPARAQMHDYVATTPTKFPHYCSLCNQESVSVKEWINHQNTELHLENCKQLRARFPEWNGQLRTYLTALDVEARSSIPCLSQSHNQRRKSSSRSRSRSYSPQRHRGSGSRRDPEKTRYRSRSRSNSPRQSSRRTARSYRSRSRSYERRSSPRQRDDRWSSAKRSRSRERHSSEKSSVHQMPSHSAEALAQKLLGSSAIQALPNQSDLEAVVKTLAPALLAELTKMKTPSSSSSSSASKKDPKAKTKRVSADDSASSVKLEVLKTMSRSFLEDIVCSFGKPMSVIFYRNENKALVVFEKPEDAEKMRNAKSEDLKGLRVKSSGGASSGSQTPAQEQKKAPPAKKGKSRISSATGSTTPSSLSKAQNVPAKPVKVPESGKKKQAAGSTTPSSLSKAQNVPAKPLKVPESGIQQNTADSNTQSSAAKPSKASAAKKPVRQPEKPAVVNKQSQLDKGSTSGSKAPAADKKDSTSSEKTAEQKYKEAARKVEEPPKKVEEPVGPSIKSTQVEVLVKQESQDEKKQNKEADAERNQKSGVLTLGEMLGKNLLMKSMVCIDMKSVFSPEFASKERHVLQITNLPKYENGNYSEQDVVDLLTPFGFQQEKEHLNNIYVIPQKRMVLAVLPTAEMVIEVVQASVKDCFTLCGCKLVVKILSESFSTPMEFYMCLMMWMKEKITSDQGENIVFIKNISPVETKILRDVLKEIGNMKNYTPLLNKVFIEFDTVHDADRLGVWYSLLHSPPLHSITRLGTPQSSTTALMPVMPEKALPDRTLRMGNVAVPRIDSIPLGCSPPFYVTTATFPFLFPTSCPWFNIPPCHDSLPVCSTVMLTGLPEDGYTQQDVVDVVWGVLVPRNVISKNYRVMVLPLQRRAFIYFNNTEACRKLALRHRVKPFCIKDKPVNIHFVNFKMEPDFLEENMYLQMMSWSNARVSKLYTLQKRLLVVEVSEVSLTLIQAVINEVASVVPVAAFLPLGNRICIEMFEYSDWLKVLDSKLGSLTPPHIWKKVIGVNTLQNFHLINSHEISTMTLDQKFWVNLGETTQDSDTSSSSSTMAPNSGSAPENRKDVEMVEQGSSGAVDADSDLANCDDLTRPMKLPEGYTPSMKRAVVLTLSKHSHVVPTPTMPCPEGPKPSEGCPKDVKASVKHPEGLSAGSNSCKEHSDGRTPSQKCIEVSMTSEKHLEGPKPTKEHREGSTLSNECSVGPTQFKECPEGLKPTEEHPEGSTPLKECSEGPILFKKCLEGPTPSKELSEGPPPFKKSREGPKPSEHHPEGSTPSKECSECPKPFRESLDGPKLKEKHPEDSTPSKEFSECPSPFNECPEGPNLNEEHPGKSTPSKDCSEGPTPFKESPEGPNPREEHSKGTTPSKKYSEGPTPFKECPEGPKLDEEHPEDSTPSVDCSEGPKPRKEHSKGSIPSKKNSEGPTPFKECPEGAKPIDEHMEVSTPSRECSEGLTPLKECPEGPKPTEEHLEGSTPSKESSSGPIQFKECLEVLKLSEVCPEGLTLSKKYPEGSAPLEESPKGSTPFKEYSEDLDPLLEQCEGLTPSKKYLEGPTQSKEHLECMIPSEKCLEVPASTAEQSQSPTPSAKLPQGPTLSDQILQGPTPSEELPQGPTPFEELPQGPTPSEELPQGPTPSEELPQGPTPFEELPQGPTPSEELPQGPTPSEELPQGPIPTEKLPQCPPSSVEQSKGSTRSEECPDCPTASNQPKTEIEECSLMGEDKIKAILAAIQQHKQAKRGQVPMGFTADDRFSDRDDLRFDQDAHDFITLDEVGDDTKNTAKNSQSSNSSKQQFSRKGQTRSHSKTLEQESKSSNKTDRASEQSRSPSASQKKQRDSCTTAIIDKSRSPEGRSHRSRNKSQSPERPSYRSRNVSQSPKGRPSQDRDNSPTMERRTHCGKNKSQSPERRAHHGSGKSLTPEHRSYTGKMKSPSNESKEKSSSIKCNSQPGEEECSTIERKERYTENRAEQEKSSNGSLAAMSAVGLMVSAKNREKKIPVEEPKEEKTSVTQTLKSEEKQEEMENYQILDVFEENREEEESQQLGQEEDQCLDDLSFQVLDSIDDEGMAEQEKNAEPQMDTSFQVLDSIAEDQSPTDLVTEVTVAENVSDETKVSNVTKRPRRGRGGNRGRKPKVLTANKDITDQEHVEIIDSVENPTKKKDPELKIQAPKDVTPEAELEPIKDEEVFQVIDSVDEQSEPNNKKKQGRRGRPTRRSARSKTSERESEEKQDETQTKLEATKPDSITNKEEANEVLYTVLDSAENETIQETEKVGRKRSTRGNKEEKITSQTANIEEEPKYQVIDSVEDYEAPEEVVTVTRSTRGRRGRTAKRDIPTRGQTAAKECEEGKETLPKAEETAVTVEEVIYKTIDSVKDEDALDTFPVSGQKTKRGRLRNAKATSKSSASKKAKVEIEEEPTYQIIDSVEEEAAEDKEISDDRGTAEKSSTPEDDYNKCKMCEKDEEEPMYQIVDSVEEDQGKEETEDIMIPGTIKCSIEGETEQKDYTNLSEDKNHGPSILGSSLLNLNNKAKELEINNEEPGSPSNSIEECRSKQMDITAFEAQELLTLDEISADEAPEKSDKDASQKKEEVNQEDSKNQKRNIEECKNMEVETTALKAQDLLTLDEVGVDESPEDGEEDGSEKKEKVYQGEPGSQSSCIEAHRSTEMEMTAFYAQDLLTLDEVSADEAPEEREEDCSERKEVDQEEPNNQSSSILKSRNKAITAFEAHELLTLDEVSADEAPEEREEDSSERKEEVDQEDPNNQSSSIEERRNTEMEITAFEAQDLLTLDEVSADEAPDEREQDGSERKEEVDQEEPGSQSNCIEAHRNKEKEITAFEAQELLTLDEVSADEAPEEGDEDGSERKEEGYQEEPKSSSSIEKRRNTEMEITAFEAQELLTLDEVSADEAPEGREKDGSERKEEVNQEEPKSQSSSRGAHRRKEMKKRMMDIPELLTLDEVGADNASDKRKAESPERKKMRKQDADVRSRSSSREGPRRKRVAMNQVDTQELLTLDEVGADDAPEQPEAEGPELLVVNEGKDRPISESGQSLDPLKSETLGAVDKEKDDDHRHDPDLTEESDFIMLDEAGDEEDEVDPRPNAATLGSKEWKEETQTNESQSEESTSSSSMQLNCSAEAEASDQSEKRRSEVKGVGKRRKDLIGPEVKRCRSQSPDVTLPTYNPNNPLGLEFVVPTSGFFCNICSMFYAKENSAKEVHCSSRRHYNNLKKYYQKLKTNPSRASCPTLSDVSSDGV